MAVATINKSGNRLSLKPAKGRLVMLEEPTSLPGYYTGHVYHKEACRLDKFDKKIGYVLNNCEPYSIVLLSDGTQQALDNGKTKYLKPTKGEREAWVEECVRNPDYRFHFLSAKGNFHGNDPELFFLDDKDQLIPAFAFLPSKADAVEVDAWPSARASERGNDTLKSKAFWDGFQAEFTTPPSTCFGWAADYIHAALKRMTEAARKVEATAKPTWKPVVDLTQQMMDTSPTACVALGCDPSFNAYFDGPNPELAAIEPSTLPCRFAGYHIHFGIKNLKQEEYANIVKLLDAIPGVISVCLFRGMEDIRRRKYYGLAGEYRLPPHGLEWRTLSSCVLSSPYTFHLMSDLSRFTSVLHLNKLSGFWKYKESEVIRAINELDVDLATKILKDNEGALMAILRSIYSHNADKARSIIHKGAAKCLPLDMYKSWKLGETWSTHSDADRATIAGLDL